MKNNNSSQMVFYTDPSGQMKVEVFLYGETAWLTQKRLAEVFDVDIRTISEHLQNIFKTGELNGDSVIRKFRTTADGAYQLEKLPAGKNTQIRCGYSKELS